MLKNYEYIYLRTNLVGSMSEGLMIPYGFKNITDEEGNIIVEKCEFPRTIDISSVDERKFLIKKLK